MVTCYTIIVVIFPRTISKLFSLETCSPCLGLLGVLGQRHTARQASMKTRRNGAEIAWSPQKMWKFPTKPWFRLGGVEYERGRDYSSSLGNPSMNVVMIPFSDLLTGDIHMAPQKICLEEAPHKTLQWSMWVLITSKQKGC